MQQRNQRLSTPEEAFALRTRELRMSAGLTQATLARRLSERTSKAVDDSTITRLESGRRLIRLNEAAVVAAILGETINGMLAPGRPFEEELAAAEADLAIAQQREAAALAAREAAQARLHELQHKSDWLAGKYPLENEE